MPAKGKKAKRPSFNEVRNSKAFHRYHVGEKFEAGLVLLGTEVKSIKAGGAQITEAFVRIENSVPILYHAHVAEYAFGNDQNHPPIRPRKLLLHKKEIEKLKMATEAEGMSIIPIRLYLKHGLIKIEVALCKGKNLYDKREALKKKEDLREAGRAFKNAQRR